MRGFGSANRVAFWICALLSSLWASIALAEGFEQMELVPGARLDVSLGQGRVMRVMLEGERLEADLEDVTLGVEAVFVAGRAALPPVLLGDVNRDGLSDVLLPVGEGYGGVNIFYTGLLPRAAGGLTTLPSLSNPVLGAEGLVTSGKDGPFWRTILWRAQPGGELVPSVEQMATGYDFALEKRFGESGSVEERLVSPERAIGRGPALQAKAPEGTAFAKAPDGAGAGVLKAERLLTLRRFDFRSELIGAENGDEGLIWVDPADLGF